MRIQISFFLLASAFSVPTLAKVVLRQPTSPACLAPPTTTLPLPPTTTTAPTPAPTTTTLPSGPTTTTLPKPTTTTLPKPPPTTTTLPPLPKPPLDLPVEGPAPESTGSDILDAALASSLPTSMLPLWHGYPWQKLPHQKTWTAFTVQTLRESGGNLLKSVPADINWYCPRYPQFSQEERLVFWTRFISVIAEAESSLNHVRAYRSVRVGPGIYSTGLMQLSLASAKQKRWGCDMIQAQDDLFQWRKNIACAVKIMDYLMGQDEAISFQPNSKQSQKWYGIARYWETVRDPRIRTAEQRSCLTEMVEARRPDWIEESKIKFHVAYRDSDYDAAGEKVFERALRLINELPLCHEKPAIQ